MKVINDILLLRWDSSYNDFPFRIVSLLLLFHFSPNYGQINTEPNAPNVIIILADDMGFGDISSYGAMMYMTPNIDQLAYEGMRLTNYDVAHPICSASRAALLTGLYANKIGIFGALIPNDSTGLNPSETTIADILKRSGYRTMAIGKWHLGDQKKYLPLQHGFDDFLGLPYSNDMVPFFYDGTRNIPKEYERKLSYPELPLIKGDSIIKRLRSLEDQSQLTTLYTNSATKFIKENKGEPFFLYLAHSMPHVPLAVSDKFKGKSEQGLYGDVLMEIDWSVGEIMKTLSENDLDRNTILIFTSDNGPWLNFGEHAGSTAGLREGKATIYEGGHRVPFIIKYPPVITPGQISNKLMTNLDVLPTIAKLAHLNINERDIDGLNMVPLLKDNDEVRKEFYYYYDDNNLKAIRRGNFKMVFPHEYFSYEDVLPGMNGLPGKRIVKKTGLALYDLRRDPGERYDVKRLYPQVRQELEKAAMEAHREGF